MVAYFIGEFDAPLKQQAVKQAVQRCAKKFSLVLALEQLKPARSHWHWKRAGSSGTLEVTWNAADMTLAVSVHENRVGTDGWAKTQAPLFAQALAERLNGQIITNG